MEAALTLRKPRNESEWEPGKYIETGIQYLGPNRFRALVRKRGVNEDKVFPHLKEAREWRAIILGQALGETYVDTRLAHRTTLAAACEWALSINPNTGRPHLHKGDQNWKNVKSRLLYWRDKSRFRKWRLASSKHDTKVRGIHDVDLKSWVDSLLAIDVGDDIEDDEAAAIELGRLEGFDGPIKPVAAQQICHRLSTLSVLYILWRQAHRLTEQQCPNPARAPNLRPSASIARRKARRLKEGEFEQLLTTASHSSRKWLPDAIIIAVETAMRQTELATLTWDRTFLDRQHPYAHLLKTKNGEERRVPLSPAAIAAFRRLRQMADRQNADRQKRIDEATTDAQRLRATAIPLWQDPLPIETGRGIIHAFRDAIDDARLRAQEAGDSNWIDIHNDLRWHDLRHEAVSRLFELTDFREEEVMDIVGHLSKDMLRYYLKIRTEQLASRLPGAKSAATASGLVDKFATVRLGRGLAPLVMDADGKWVTFDAADEIARSYAKKALRDALKAIEDLECSVAAV